MGTLFPFPPPAALELAAGTSPVSPVTARSTLRTDRSEPLASEWLESSALAVSLTVSCRSGIRRRLPEVDGVGNWGRARGELSPLLLLAASSDSAASLTAASSLSDDDSYL